MTDKKQIIEAARRSAAYQREIANGVDPQKADAFLHAANVMSAFADTVESDAV